MRKLFHQLLASLRGKNSNSTPTDVILDQLSESRPLPLGRQEWDEWSERIISGALVTAEKSSQQFCLANMLLHLGPTESHKSDAYFIHSLRKFAINQVADTIRKELHESEKARLAAIEASKSEEQKKAEDAGAATLLRIGKQP